MGFRLAELFVTIGAEDAALNKALAGIRGKLAKLAATRFNVPGGGFLAALGLGAGVAGIGKAISGASDLSETLSKVGAVFGAQSSEVTKAADEMAKAFGIPKREFLDAASQFGLIATGMGQTQAEAAAMSAKFAKLAVDASSFYNVPVAEALEKIRAGLTGELEPLKAFGVIMDETTMKSYAVAAGIAKAGQELNNSQKLAARAALIQRGLATATGDMARTQDGAANQVRKFWGSLTNLGDTLGATILPTFTKFVNLLNEVATDLGNAATSGTSSWSGFFDFFGAGIEAAGTIYRNWGDIVERTGVMIGGSLQNAWEYLSYGGEVAAATAKYIGDEMAAAFDLIVQLGVNAKDNLVNIFTEIFDYIKSMGKDPIEFKLKPIMEGVTVKGDGKLDLPKLNLSSVDDQLKTIDDRMAAREGARLDDKAKAKAGAASPGGPAGPMPGGGAKNTKVGVTDIDSYSRELTEGALKGGDVAQSQLKVQESMDKNLAAIAKNTEKSGARAAVATFQ